MLITDKIYIDQYSRPHNVDEHWMRMAILEAYQAQGFTKPNPMVGAVIIDQEGRVLAKAHHPFFGASHAEVLAIEAAKKMGFDLKNSILYCTLEPCCHTEKKTPPCLPKVLEQNFSKVVIGRLDPNPKVSGKSIEVLKNKGITVQVGVLEKACSFLIREFIHEQQKARPYLHLKIAQSLDGSHGPTQGENSDARWMTNSVAKDYVHSLRAISNSVLIGGETLRQDTPKLNCRLGHFQYHPHFKQPQRCVLTNKELPTDSDSYHVFKNFDEIIQSQFQRILIEAGPKLMALFLEQGIFDELSIILTPYFLGNIQKIKFMQDYGLDKKIDLSHGKWIPLENNMLFHWVKNYH
jgi:diaminohydroxyphosphoribosylaminopyrimidine deaminase/5-amino-6-(5-phosphoribosylamino)uracil reductase